MKSICYLFFVTSIICFCNVYSSGQDANLTADNFIASPPVSPNVANLGLHTTVPIDLFSGLPQIQIPLVELEDRDFSIPVSLSYHSDGVKPDVHPGWTGLGWSLMNAGGSITRIRKGGMDEIDIIREGEDLSYYANYGTLNPDNWFGNEGIEYALSTDGGFYKDFEPDEFLFSMPGFSGKFFLNHSGKWVFTSNSGEQFEMDMGDVQIMDKEGGFKINGADFYDNSNDDYFEAYIFDGSLKRFFYGFTITGNNGVSYTFGGTDESIEYTKENMFISPSTPSNGYDMIPTAWHLTKMESPNGNIITFNYKRDGVSISESATSNFFEYQGDVFTNGFWIFDNWQEIHAYTGRPRSINYAVSYPSYLEEIVGSNGKIVFETEHSDQLAYGIEQEHLPPGSIDIIADFYALEETYSIYPKLNRVYLERNGQVVKDMDLTYLDVPTNRLRLTSVSEGPGTAAPPPYSFHYNPEQLPDYNSLRVDHWGYYNTDANYFETLPAQHRFSWTDVEPYFNSRNPDKILMQAEILTQIDYPTGGNTFFEYEPNSYSRQANKYPFDVSDVTEQITGGLRIKKIYSSAAQGEEPITKEYLYVDDYAAGDLRSSGVLSGTPDYLEIDSFRTETSGGSFQTVRYWNISKNNINPLNETNGRHVTYTNVVEKFSDGGYREIKYTNHENGTSYLDQPPLSIFASFHLRPEQDPHISKQRVRGKPLRERIYRNDNTLLQEKNYQYEVPDDEIHEVRCINKYQKIFFKQSNNPALENFFIKDIRATAYLQYLFPVHLTSETIKQYDENGQNPVSQTINYQYNTDNNLVRTEAYNCNDHKLISTYKYPKDYNTDYSGNTSDNLYRGIRRLNQEGINNIPIETLNLVERDAPLTTYVLGGSINSFDDDLNSVHQAAVYQLEIDPPIPYDDFQESLTNMSGIFTRDNRYQQVIDISRHSNTGTPLEAQRTKDEPVSVIMSKDELRPVARVVGAKYNDIAYTSFEMPDDIGSKANGRWTLGGTAGGWDNSTAHTGINSFNLSQVRDISTAVVTAGDYLLTFWAKGGTGFDISVAGSVVQSTSTTGSWAYYEIPLTGLAANTSIMLKGKGADYGEKIDELRLYPKNTLMSTYNYDPANLQVTSIADANSRANHFEYDAFNRLQYVYDQNNNLVGYNDYQYKENGAVQNHIQSISILEEGKNIADISTLALKEKQHTFQYFDGLGRLTQSAAVGQSPAQKDMIQITDYDIHGRQSKQYLPYAYGSSGAFRTNAIQEQSLVHRFSNSHARTSVPYAETVFEQSPLNRADEQCAPGATWKRGSGHTMTMQHGIHTGPPIYDLQYPDANGYAAEYSNLYSEQQTDEQGRIGLIYTKAGKQIANRRQAPNGKYTDTYYHYDDYGNVITIIPPQAIEELITCNDQNGNAPTGSIDLNACSLNEDLLFRYQYDERQRVIAKKIPGAGWTYYVYDILDRVVMTQDANQNATGQWLYTKYDNLGRAIITGFYTNADTRTAIQNWITIGNRNGSIPLYETRDGSSSTGYTNHVVPQNQSEELTIIYYDDYDFDGDGSSDYAFIQDNTDFPDNSPFARTAEQVTGTKVKILGTNTWLTTAHFYDEYGRVIQTQSNNHLGGTETVSNQYDFVGTLLKTKRKHTAPNQADLTIRERYTYDHARRLTNVFHKINNEPEVRLKYLKYNELQQVSQMNLHETGFNSDKYLQTVDYRYNERGWLTRINQLKTTDCAGPDPCTALHLKVALEGPMLNDGIMNTALNKLEILPGQAKNPGKGQPYKTAPWGYAGIEGKANTNDLYAPEAVDWILVSLRTGIAADTEIFKAAALLHADGTVHFTNDMQLPDDLPPVYIVVEHCNHIGVMSPQPVSIQNDSLVYDFTVANSYTANGNGTGQRLHSSGKWVMLAGDGAPDNFSFDINGADKSAWGLLNGVFGEYLVTDYNRDGDVNGNDKISWEKNNGRSSRVPRATRNTATEPDSTLIANIKAAGPDPGPVAYTDLFNMHINYTATGGALNATPQYNGNISHVRWQVKDKPEDIKTYRYGYDELDRLNYALYRRGANYGTEVNDYTVQNISYDLNGNIQSLKRNGGADLMIDDLTYAYNGNQLTNVKDDGDNGLGFADGSSYDANNPDYEYDANGNLISDDNKGITSITYNYLNLPETITFTNGTITFLYDANGNKLSKTVSTGVQKDYLGGIEYNNGAVEAVYHEEGRATLQGSTWQYEYSLKDHLGNTRVIFADTNNDGTPEIIQESDYYPFGMQHTSSTTATNHYLYNSKELNDDLGLDWYDYGARWQDPTTGRFTTIDRFAEDFPFQSSYSMASNNPISSIDINGDSTYLIIYGSGWVNPEAQGQVYDVGNAFKKNAEAQAENIRNSSGFNAQTDAVEVIYAPTEQDFIDATNKQYASGEIIQLDVYSHGTENDINLGGEATDVYTQQDKRWVGAYDDARDSNSFGEQEFKKIDANNFSNNATCTLWGCNQGGYKPSGSSRSAAQALANQLGGNKTVRAFVGGGGAEFKRQNGRNVYDGTMIRSADRRTQITNLTIFKKKP